MFNQLKLSKYFIVLITALITQSAFADEARHYSNRVFANRCQITEIQGGIDLFPWSMARPFPWKDIQGMWSAEFNGIETYFSFRVVRVGSSGRQIRIVRYNDLVSCFVLAKGTGHENSNQLKAQLVNSEGNTFKMAVGEFDSANLRMDLKCDATVMGMRLSDFNTLEEDMISRNKHKKPRTENDRYELMSGPIYKVSDKITCKQIIDR